MDKFSQRRIINERLSNFLPLSKKDADISIAKNLFSLDKFMRAKSVFIYLSTDREADTSAIIQEAFALGKRVFVPVTGEDMSLCEIFPGTVYIKGAFGIKEPKDKLLSDTVPDIAVVPLLGFDENLNRLGKGKGYYDRYLAGKKITKIAIAYETQKLDKVETDSFDIKMDIIVTEEKIYFENYKRNI